MVFSYAIVVLCVNMNIVPSCLMSRASDRRIIHILTLSQAGCLDERLAPCYVKASLFYVDTETETASCTRFLLSHIPLHCVR